MGDDAEEVCAGGDGCDGAREFEKVTVEFAGNGGGEGACGGEDFKLVTGGGGGVCGARPGDSEGLGGGGECYGQGVLGAGGLWE